MFIATLVAKDALAAGDISMAADAVRGRADALVDGVACDIAFEGSAAHARAALEGLIADVDVIVQRAGERGRKLIVADMDSTMITVECIDELADYAGIKPEIEAITERAMAGELDFEAALTERVGLLKGLPERVLGECLAERVEIMPGAKALVRTICARGGMAVMVSGGFTHFAEPVAAEIGFDRVVSNRLGLLDGALDGTVARPVVGAASKKAALLTALAERGWPVAASLAVGDGANDIPMIEAAGLGVAYHAKPRTRGAADAAVIHGDLTVPLYALGIPKAEWAAES